MCLEHLIFQLQDIINPLYLPSTACKVASARFAACSGAPRWLQKKFEVDHGHCSVHDTVYMIIPCTLPWITGFRMNVHMDDIAEQRLECERGERMAALYQRLERAACVMGCNSDVLHVDVTQYRRDRMQLLGNDAATLSTRPAPAPLSRLMRDADDVVAATAALKGKFGDLLQRLNECQPAPRPAPPRWLQACQAAFQATYNNVGNFISTAVSIASAALNVWDPDAQHEHANEVKRQVCPDVHQVHQVHQEGSPKGCPQVGYEDAADLDQEISDM